MIGRGFASLGPAELPQTNALVKSRLEKSPRRSVPPPWAGGWKGMGGGGGWHWAQTSLLSPYRHDGNPTLRIRASPTWWSGRTSTKGGRRSRNPTIRIRASLTTLEEIKGFWEAFYRDRRNPAIRIRASPTGSHILRAQEKIYSRNPTIRIRASPTSEWLSSSSPFWQKVAIPPYELGHLRLSPRQISDFKELNTQSAVTPENHLVPTFPYSRFRLLRYAGSPFPSALRFSAVTSWPIWHFAIGMTFSWHDSWQLQPVPRRRRSLSIPSL